MTCSETCSDGSVAVLYMFLRNYETWFASSCVAWVVVAAIYEISWCA